MSKILIYIYIITIVAVISFLILSYINVNTAVNESTDSDSDSTREITYYIDSIYERTDPNTLDLSIEQIFIDTTRNSRFYKEIENWMIPKESIGLVIDQLEDIRSRKIGKKVILDIFPSRLIPLRRLDGEFLLYNPCDGIDQRIAIIDSFLLYIGPLESDFSLITDYIQLSEDTLMINYAGIKFNNEIYEEQTTIIRFDDTKYQVLDTGNEYQSSKYYTTIDKIRYFDMVVEHCPRYKVRWPFDIFDKE